MISALLLTTLLGAGPGLSLDVNAAIREVERGFIEDGEDQVSTTSTHRVIVHRDGWLELEGRQPLRLSLQSVRRQGAAACATRTLSRDLAAGAQRTVRTLRACGVEERWTNHASGLEHTFTLQRPPAGTGALRLFVAVEGPWHHQDQGGHVFAGPGAAERLRYGNAFVVRAGKKLPITVARVQGGLELVVPQALVDAPGAFPLHIDPVLSAEVPLDLSGAIGSSASNESRPAVAVDPQGQALVVWTDTRRPPQTDLVAVRMDPSRVMDPVGIPFVYQAGDQKNATVAWNGSSFVVAWQHDYDGGSSIRARTFSFMNGTGPIILHGDGAEPALAGVPDAGYSVLAYVEPDAGIQVVKLLGASFAGALNRPPFDGGTVSRPAVAASGRSHAVAWEHTAVGGTTSTVQLWWAGFLGSLVSSTADSRRPTVALIPSGGVENPVVFWEQPAMSNSTVAGVRVFDGIVASFGPWVGTSPALLSFAYADDVLPTLGYLNGGYLQIRDLASANSPTGTSLGARPLDLAMAVGPPAFAAWTEGIFPGDIFGMALPNPLAAPGSPVRVSNSGPLQVLPQVAIREGKSSGMTVWVEGGNTLKAATVTLNPGGPAIGPPLSLLNRSERIERLALASSQADTYLLAWRESATVGSRIYFQLLSSTGLQGNVQQVGGITSQGPAVAFDEVTQLFALAFTDGAVNRQPSVLTVGLTGTVANQRSLNADFANDLGLACFARRCVLVWERSGVQRECRGLVFELPAVTPIVGTQPFVINPPANRPFASHDGTNFVVGWHSNGLSFAEVRPGDGALVLRMQGVAGASNMNIPSAMLAPGRPPVVVWQETMSDETSLKLARLDFVDPTQLLRSGGSVPSVTTVGVNDAPTGVVVYQRFDANMSRGTTGAYATMFTFDAGVDAGSSTPDAGLDAGFDGGHGDAGVVDAGSTDGGTTAGDGGVMEFEANGCACHAVSLHPLLLLGLALLGRKRRAAAR